MRFQVAAALFLSCGVALAQAPQQTTPPNTPAGSASDIRPGEAKPSAGLPGAPLAPHDGSGPLNGPAKQRGPGARPHPMPQGPDGPNGQAAPGLMPPPPPAGRADHNVPPPPPPPGGPAARRPAAGKPPAPPAGRVDKSLSAPAPKPA